VPGSSVLAKRLRRLRGELRLVVRLRRLPPRAVLFIMRARAHAWRSDDRFSLASAAGPADLAVLLALARGRRHVVELGTGTAWTAIVLAVADPARRVITYDPEQRAQTTSYLQLAGAAARGRIELRGQADSTGPHDFDHPVELLFIDSSHERAATAAAYRAWLAALAPGALVVFHDYDHPGYPGVSEAIAELELTGEIREGLFVWCAP
jgi:predicted O-methyltransferase YrrM